MLKLKLYYFSGKRMFYEGNNEGEISYETGGDKGCDFVFPDLPVCSMCFCNGAGGGGSAEEKYC